MKHFCGRSPPVQSELNCWSGRQRTPLWDRDHSGNDRRLVPFSQSLSRDVPGTVPENARTCGFKRNSSSLYRAHKMRDCVLLKAWDSFSVTLPSTSSETCVMYPSVIPGTDVFCDWLFLVSSCVCFETTANIRLFLSVAIFSEGKTQQ